MPDRRQRRPEIASRASMPGGRAASLDDVADPPARRAPATPSAAAGQGGSASISGDVASAETVILYDLVFPGPRAVIGLDGESAIYSDALSAVQTASGAQLARNTVVAVLARFMTYGISLPLSIITARLLGPHDKGIYTLFLLVVVLFTYCTLGVSSAGIYFVGKKLYALRDVVGSLLSLGLMLAVGIGALYTLAALVLPLPVVSELPPALRLAVSVLGPLTLLSMYLSDCLLAAHDIVGYNIGNIVQVFCQAGGFALFLLLYKQALAAATISYALGVVLAFGVVLALLRRHTPLRPSWRPRLLREMFSFGLKSYLTSLLNLGNLRLDSALLSIFVSVAAVGQYSVATTISEMTWQLPLVMSTVLFPTAAAASSASGAKIIARACRRLLLILVICLLALLIGAPVAIRVLFGTSYLPAVTPLLLLLPGAIGFTVYKTLYSYLLGNGRPAVGILSAGASLLVTVVLDVLLIPRYGISGAAMTSSIAYCLNGLIVLVAFVRIGKVGPLETLVATARDVRDILTQVSVLVRKLRARLARQTGGAAASAPGAGAGVTAAFGVIVGLWVSALVLGLDPALALLGMIAVLLVLGLSQRLWLAAAILAADLTLTDFYLPLPGALSLRVVIGGLMGFILLLSFVQGRARLDRDTSRMFALLLGFITVASLSNVVNGGSTTQFLSHTLAGAIVLFYLATLVRSTRDLLIVGGALIVVGALSTLTGILQVLLRLNVTIGSADDRAQWAGRAFGLAQTPISLANGLTILLALLAATLLCLRPRRRIALGGWLLVALLALGVYLSGSRSGLLAMGAVVGVLTLALRPRIRLVALVVLLAGGIVIGTRLVGGSDTAAVVATRGVRDTELSSTQRLVLWDAGLLMVRDHPLLGIGYNNFMPLSPRYAPQVSPRFQTQPKAVAILGKLPPHNDFLTMLIAYGPLGLLTFLGLHLLGAWSAWTSWRRARNPWLRAAALGCLAALVAYSIHALVHNAYDDTLQLWAILGTILAVRRLRAAEPHNVLEAVAPAASRASG